MPDFGGEPAEQNSGPPPDLGLQAVRVENLRIDYRDAELQSRLGIREPGTKNCEPFLDMT